MISFLICILGSVSGHLTRTVQTWTAYEPQSFSGLVQDISLWMQAGVLQSSPSIMMRCHCIIQELPPPPMFKFLSRAGEGNLNNKEENFLLVPVQNLCQALSEVESSALVSS